MKKSKFMFIVAAKLLNTGTVEFESQLLCFSRSESGESYLTSICFSFLNYKARVIGC